jgi:hypothetical protein
MNSDYLKKPILSKKIEYKKLSTFSYVSCEMQGKPLFIKDGVELWKMQFFMKKYKKEYIYLEFLMAMVDLKWLIMFLQYFPKKY